MNKPASVLVWNDHKIVVAHTTEDVEDDVLAILGRELGTGDLNDPRWQIVFGHIEVELRSDAEKARTPAVVLSFQTWWGFFFWLALLGAFNAIITTVFQ